MSESNFKWVSCIDAGILTVDKYGLSENKSLKATSPDKKDRKNNLKAATECSNTEIYRNIITEYAQAKQWLRAELCRFLSIWPRWRAWRGVVENALLQRGWRTRKANSWQRRANLQYDAMWCNVMQCDAMWCNVMQCIALLENVFEARWGNHSCWNVLKCFFWHLVLSPSLFRDASCNSNGSWSLEICWWSMARRAREMARSFLRPCTGTKCKGLDWTYETMKIVTKIVWNLKHRETSWNNCIRWMGVWYNAVPIEYDRLKNSSGKVGGFGSLGFPRLQGIEHETPYSAWMWIMWIPVHNFCTILQVRSPSGGTSFRCQGFCQLQDQGTVERLRATSELEALYI